MTSDNSMTTYRMAVVEARAHRVVKMQVSSLLKKYNLTMMQWSIIGLVAEYGNQGVRISDLAAQLDTSLAFVTTTVNVLESKGALVRESHQHDSRSKLVKLTKEYRKQIARIEADTHDQLSTWFEQTVGKSERRAYMGVLQQIAQSA